jgi:hypothetical protein
MTLYCSLCKDGPLRPFTSLLIDKEEALQEVGQKLTEHMIKSHPKVVAQIQTDVLLLNVVAAGYMAIERCAKIPEEETYALERKEQNEAKIMELLGWKEIAKAPAD